MMAYLDASVVVRKLQREAGSLRQWGQWEHVYSSELLRVEVLRAIDRSRLRGALTDIEMANVLENARMIFDHIEFVELSRSIFNRAAESFPTPLGTLDALHLCTALSLIQVRELELVFATHDSELALAARSMNFQVTGV